MASVMSLAMMVFIAVPVVAPSFGQAVLLTAQWRGIFVALMIYGVVALIWCALRMPETLPVEMRKSLALPEVFGAYKQTVTNRQTLGYALAAGGVWGAMFAFVFSARRVAHRHLQARPLLSAGLCGRCHRRRARRFLQFPLVGRLGMRVISHGALVTFAIVAVILLVAELIQMLPLPLFMALSAVMMFSFGLMMANFTALAMEPHGHIAGTASSLYGSITTLLGIGVGMAIGLSFDGTLLPFSIGFCVCALAALGIAAVTEKGRLFPPASRAGQVNPLRCAYGRPT